MSLEQTPSLSILTDQTGRTSEINITNPGMLKRSFWEQSLQLLTDTDPEDPIQLSINYSNKDTEIVRPRILRNIKKKNSEREYYAFLQHLIDYCILNATSVSLTEENDKELVPVG